MDRANHAIELKRLSCTRGAVETPVPSHRGPFSEANPARLILIDDHAILREGLIALSNMESDLKVVGQAGTIAEGLAVAQAHHPDLILTDLALPGSTGLQGIVEFRSRVPASK